MKTLVSFIEYYSNKYASHPFMWEKSRTGGTEKPILNQIEPEFKKHVDPSYEPVTYKQTLENVYEFGAGLMALGVEPGDRIALLSEGRVDWVISEMGILFIKAINVPLSVKLSPVELQFRLFHSGASVLIVSENHYGKLSAVRSNLPGLQRIILLDSKDNYAEEEISKKQICKMGRQLLEKRRNAFIKRKNAVTPEDAANISYTSGTTADPKGIILTHRNYTANVEQALTLMDIPPTYRTLLILPLDHSFAHTAGIYSFMAKGASIGMVQAGKTAIETLRNIPTNIKEFRPNLLLSVPALAKSFKKNIESAIRSKGPVIEKLFANALKTAYAYNREGYNKNKRDWYRRTKLLMYDTMLFKKIRANFGGQLHFFIGGGALLDIELQRFFYAIGIPMMQGYGLSEATPIVSSNSLKRHKLGSSGHLVEPLELKIIDDEGKDVPTGEKGEIIIKGENVMKGYWKNPSATRDALRNGWLYTGDMGYMDKDGFLYVLGRFKSLLIGHDGEKYSPESIEETITEKSPVIEQLMLHNNQDPYTIGLLYPNVEVLKRAIRNKKNPTISGQIIRMTKETMTTDEDIDSAIEIIKKELDYFYDGGKYGDMFPDRWLPTSIGILKKGFTEENKMMNSTMKIVRGKIEEHYDDLIQYLFLPEAKKPKHTFNKEAIRHLLES